MKILVSNLPVDRCCSVYVKGLEILPELNLLPNMSSKRNPQSKGFKQIFFFLFRGFILVQIFYKNTTVLLSLKSTGKILVSLMRANFKFYFSLGPLEYIFVALFSNTRQFWKLMSMCTVDDKSNDFFYSFCLKLMARLVFRLSYYSRFLSWSKLFWPFQVISEVDILPHFKGYLAQKKKAMILAIFALLFSAKTTTY